MTLAARPRNHLYRTAFRIPERHFFVCAFLIQPQRDFDHAGELAHNLDLDCAALDRKRYEKGTALVAAYSPRLKRIGIQNWRRASTVAGMSRQAFDAQRGVAKGIAGRPASSTQWNRIGRSR